MRSPLSSGLLALAAAALLLVPPSARAAVSVTPTRVTLSKAKPTELLSLTNQGDDEARFQVSVFGWSESGTGEQQLTPTNDVVAFPPLLTIAPHQSRNLRIGVVTPPGAAEKSYRVIVQELPHAPKPGVAVQIQVLTKLSLPVFLAPSGAARIEAKIEQPSLAQSVLSFTVANEGTAHTQIEKLHAAGAGPSGKTFDVTAPGWYLLAGEHRIYQVEIAARDCRETRKIALEAVTSEKTLTAQFAVPPDACAGASPAKTTFRKVVEASATAH